MKWGYLLMASVLLLTYSIFNNLTPLAVASGIALLVVVKSSAAALLRETKKKRQRR